MISISTLLKYYKREDIQREILSNALDREVAVKFGDKGFGKRPDILTYPKDVLELAKKGATSFHASEERWSNALQLDPKLKKDDINDLRIGWDLVIDIDCPYWEYSKIMGDLVIKALKHYNIQSISVKFSGNKGFHIGVPFEAFPKKIAGQDVSDRFPEDIREIAFHIKDMTKNICSRKIVDLEKGDINKISQNLGKDVKELVIGKRIDPDKIMDIDTILISSRHLYRMPYSLHEKSGLASVPVDPDKILDFDKKEALPENVVAKPNRRFLNREGVVSGEAKELFDRSVAQKVNRESKTEFVKSQTKKYDIPQEAISADLFPPCIHNILKGLKDGKKRSLFVLTNFLVSCGWNYEDIEKIFNEWNKKNEEPLRENLIVGQIRYHKQQKKKILPPNCQNQMYYKDLGVCVPDNLCDKIKNPVNYSKRKAWFLNNQKKTKKKSGKEENNKENKSKNPKENKENKK